MGCAAARPPEADESTLYTDESGIRHCSHQYVRDYFDHSDSDKSGSVDANELINILISLGTQIDDETSKNIAATIIVADDNENGTLDFEEFSQFLYSFLNAKSNDLKSILFFICDGDQSGRIDASELVQVLEKLGSKTELNKAEQLIEMFSDRLDGTIDYKGFIKLMIQLDVK
ncbi:EF_hand domain-containing protein [Hexamita inflata]|uniref:EF hand domain-containing protein n=1 Tax=Hexamita inflata TaxID=28002 RepID=A0AA86NUW7_9EUKA|nr:EF hand domain-containing protein [Hexamita inflata]